MNELVIIRCEVLALSSPFGRLFDFSAENQLVQCGRHELSLGPGDGSLAFRAALLRRFFIISLRLPANECEASDGIVALVFLRHTPLCLVDDVDYRASHVQIRSHVLVEPTRHYDA